MEKLGRNDPCHCGSGKKYKKCCIEADEAALVKTKEPEKEFTTYEDDNDILENEPSITHQSFIDSVNDDNDSIKPGLPVPDISDENNAFLDKWYENYDKISGILEQLKAAEMFIAGYPQLVPVWGFEGEYMLDLLCDCLKNGYSGEMCNFLLSFRNNFPEVYLREFGYFDNYLIYNLLINGKLSDIPSFLDNYEQHPDSFPDELFKMIQIVSVKGGAGILYPFLKKIQKSGYDILWPLILHIEGKYINSEIFDNQFINICNEIKDTVEVELSDEYFQVDYWKKQYEIYFSETGTFSCNIKNTKERKTAYQNFLKQFQRYLFENITRDWVAAVLISSEVLGYIGFTFEKNMVKNTNYFAFKKNLIDNYMAQNFKNYFWIDSYKANSLLTGIWYFLEFLVKTGNAEEAEKNEIRKGCSELYTLLQQLNNRDIESYVFNNYPFWQI